MDLFFIIDVAGTVAFSISGVMAAIEKKLDILGVFIIAFIAALGGGTLRDVLIGNVPVNWMRDMTPVFVVFTSTVLAFLFTNALSNWHKLLILFDTLGLGFFTIVGVKIGLNNNINPLVCLILGTITATFGGVIRDISLNNIPLLFEREVYATACIIGGIIYLGLIHLSLPYTVVEWFSILTIVAIRFLAIRNNWQLPKIG